MRLKSEMWVKAYLRRAAVGGCPAVVVRHGDDDAGAIFIKINRLDGTADVYGPAPAGLDSGDRDRRWVPFLDGVRVADALADAKLAREAGFDSDLWIVEVESRDGFHFLEGWLSATP